MSAAVLAGMRLKPFWLWFISASYAQTLYLLYKHCGEFCHLCGIVGKVRGSLPRLLFIAELLHLGFKNPVKLDIHLQPKL